MYNQSIIDSIGEKNLKNILDGKYNLDINNLNSKYQHIYYAFQHYLIKAYLNGYNNSACTSYLRKMYNDFYNYPYLFCDSPLINNKTLQSIFGNTEQMHKIINYRSNYYNVESINKILKKRQNENLTEQEKNQYYSYLITLLNTNYKNSEQFLTKEIERIINTDYNSLSDIELKFYCQYVSKYAIGNRPLNSVVMIGVDDPKSRGYNSNSYIFINKNAFKSIDILTKTVCHETRHLIQHYESHEKETLAGFEIAQKNLFCKYLSTKNYDSYHENYKYSTIEIDAEQVGHWSASVFFTMFKKHEFAESVRENRRVTTDKRHYYSYMVDENKKAHTSDEFIVTNLDNIIINNREELNTYPVLKRIYNSNGTKKNFDELISGRMNETVEDRGIYDNYINYGIANDELNNIKINKIGKNTMKRYIASLGSIYRNYALELNDYYKNNDNTYNPKQILFATNYKLLLSQKILSYINTNYDVIANSFKDESFNSKNPIFDFIYDLRDFNIADIESEVIKNNKETIENIKRIKRLSDNISQKFNKSYMDDLLNKIPKEILSKSIMVPEIGNINFEDYFRNIILPKMDGHKEVLISNKKYYVGDLIIEASKMLNENFKNDAQNNNKTR